MIPPCPDCGEPRGGRYLYGDGSAAGVCWPCWMKRTGLGLLPPDPPFVVFRKRIIDALCAIDKERFVYINEDKILGPCPICITGYVAVYFHGRAPRADITCSLGCAEADIARAIAGRRATR